MDAVLIVGCILFIGFFLVKKINGTREFFNKKMTESILRSSLEQDQFRDRLKRIFADYDCDATEQSGKTIEDQLLQRASKFVQIVVRETTNRADKQMSQLSDNELFAAMLIGFIASAYISYTIQRVYTCIDSNIVSYEAVSLVSCGVLGIQTNKPAEIIGYIIREAGKELDGMNDSSNKNAVMQSIGNKIESFFETGKEEYLDRLAIFYKEFLSSMVDNNIEQTKERA